MSKIMPDKLEPGMKLLRPVMNASGMVLLGEGTELTAKLVEKIRGIGVDSVFVQGVSQPSMPREEALKAIEERFGPVEGKPYMDIVKKIVIEHMEGLYGQH